MASVDQPWQSGRCWAPTSEHIPPEISVGKKCTCFISAKVGSECTELSEPGGEQSKVEGGVLKPRQGVRHVDDEMVVMLQSAWPCASEWHTVMLSDSGLFTLSQLAGEQHVLLGEQTDGKRFPEEHGPRLFLGQQKMLICAGW